MSALLLSIRVLHVIIATLGLGSIVSVALVAAVSRQADRGSKHVSAWLAPLLRFSAISLGAMLLTGILMDIVSGGTFHDWWWFRGSALLLVITGALHGRARRMVRRDLEPDRARDAVLYRVERLAYGMSALIVAITILMEVKPF